MSERVSSRRKVRIDAWWAGLSEEECAEIYAKRKRAPWHETVKWLREEKGIEVSRCGIFRFDAFMRKEEAANRILSVEASKRIAKGIQNVDVDYRLAADMFTGLSVDAAAQGNGEAAKILGDAAAKYAAAALAAEKLSLDRAAQKTKEDALALAREKFEAAEKREAAARATVQDEALSPEEQVARMKEIFGIR